MLYPVLRFFTLLFAFALMLTNGAAVAIAMCQHESTQAHAAALQSQDTQESSAALAEDMAERSASQEGTGADLSPMVVALIPDAAALPHKIQLSARAGTPEDQTAPPNRSIMPRLRPPLR